MSLLVCVAAMQASRQTSHLPHHRHERKLHSTHLRTHLRALGGTQLCARGAASEQVIAQAKEALELGGVGTWGC